jgi:2-oxoisovalerate dehydrogenase E1 component
LSFCGLTAEEIILNGISKATDVSSGGRHMSNHFPNPNGTSITFRRVPEITIYTLLVLPVQLNIMALRVVAITSHGESATSEGYVYEAITGAAREQLLLFCFAG